jgi:poly [ADP-ribose] polymerase
VPSDRFYVLQLLHPIGNNTQCTLYTRWGRVGENGANQVKVLHRFVVVSTLLPFFLTQGPWPSAMAIKEFKKQFRAKAGIAWEQRHGMVAQKGEPVVHFQGTLFLFSISGKYTYLGKST